MVMEMATPAGAACGSATKKVSNVEVARSARVFLANCIYLAPLCDLLRQHRCQKSAGIDERYILFNCLKAGEVYNGAVKAL